MKNFQAREKLATWRRTHGFDRDDSCVHGTLLLSPKESTQSLWSEVNALKDAISMPFRARPWQKTMKFVDGLKGDLPDETLAAIKRYVERQSREAAQVAVPPVSTAHHCIPRSLNPEMPSHVYISMEEKEEGRMNPELTELEPSSAGTGYETPGQQCRTRGYRRKEEPPPTAICSLAWDRTRGETPLHQRSTLVREPGQLRHRQNPGTRQRAKKTSNLTPVGKEKRHRFGTRLYFCFPFSWGELWAMGGSLFLLRVLVFACLPACSLFIVPSRSPLFIELKNMRGDADQVAHVRNRRASIFLPINPSKTITAISGSMHRMR